MELIRKQSIGKNRKTKKNKRVNENEPNSFVILTVFIGIHAIIRY